MSEIKHHKVFYCSECEEVDIEYPNYPPLDMCDECNVKLEQIGWVECDDCPVKDKDQK
jgi:hypothetical protein